MKPTLPAWIVVVALFGGLVWSASLARVHLTGAASVLDRFETVLLDLRIALLGHRAPPSNIAIVAIDDRTVASIGRYPLPRERMATLVDRIRTAGARVLAVDVLLASESNEDDMLLANALGTIPTVIAGAGRIGDALPDAGFVPTVESILAPAPKARKSAFVGLANMVTDAGGTPRHVPLLFLTAGGLQPALSLRAVSLFLDETPRVTESGLRYAQRIQPLDFGWHLPLNYYGPEGTIPTVSAIRLLQDDPDPAVDLDDRLVVLGVTATAIGERFGTPFDPVMPGVEVQATAIANLMEGSPLVRNASTRLLDATIAVTITLLGLVAVARIPLASACVIFLLLVTGWLVTITILLGHGVWLNGALPLAAGLPPVGGLILARQAADRFQARGLLRAREALSRFQSPLLAKRIAEDPTFLSTPREQQAAILFVDLSGYTGLSEKLGAAKTRDFLKDFHTILVDAASAENGIVLDFMGDGAFFGFGIPETGAMDPVRAYRCAFALEKTVTAWLEDSETRADISRIRVGGHIGPVVLSRLGHDSQQQIAATGDCVNVASRLLEVAKDHHASIALSCQLIDAVEDRMKFRTSSPRLETVAIRGRREPLRVGLWNSCDTAKVPA